MAGVDVAAKIKKGLAKVNVKLGSGELVYLVRETTSGGTPISPPTVITETILLLNAVLKTIKLNQMTNTLIQEGDRELITDSDVEINVNDKIIQGNRKMTVVSAEPVIPIGAVLVYKCVVRDL